MENQPDYFLDIRKVSKQYATQKAVDQVSLQIPKGSVFGLLGPNGAGKTSLIRMITGITMPDEGSINFNGHPFKTSDQNKIGYMPEERGLYKKMKVRDQIIYLLQLKGMQEIAAQKAADIWLVKMEIDTWKNR
ncbi:MAG: ATP-binding cassette domain-containing protein, partial [Sphingobacteriia bacterium]|nr:ATP-binding cassette domain-containing protein [Sphingobacteriia bacterium]